MNNKRLDILIMKNKEKGTVTTFNHPAGIGVDVSGNIYVADQYNHMIRKISTAGLVTTLAGTRSPGAVDGTGNCHKF